MGSQRIGCNLANEQQQHFPFAALKTLNTEPWVYWASALAKENAYLFTVLHIFSVLIIFSQLDPKFLKGVSPPTRHTCLNRKYVLSKSFWNELVVGCGGFLNYWHESLKSVNHWYFGLIVGLFFFLSQLLLLWAENSSKGPFCQKIKCAFICIFLVSFV